MQASPRSSCEAVDLLTVRQTAVVPSPRPHLSIPQKVRTGNVGGNLYSVPDATRKRIVAVLTLL
jgi:hypothetical protein